VPLGAYDVLTLAVAAACYLLGRSRGLVWQLSGLATLVGGGICATVLSKPVGLLFGSGLLARFLAWVLIYAAVAVCLYVLTLKFRDRIKELEFDELDKRFGGIVGAIKGLALFFLITLIAVGVAPRLAGPVGRSASGRALRALVGEVRALLPERIHEPFGPWLEGVSEDLPGPSRGGAAAEPSPTPTRPSPTAPSPAPTEEPTPTAPTPAAPTPTPTSTPTEEVDVFGPPLPPRVDDDLRRPGRRDEAPDLPPPPDPFDTSEDPPDPLAPPPR